MPMSKAFQDRLFPNLPLLKREFGTPYYIYDEAGIRQTCRYLKDAFRNVPGFREFYAVKALPNPAILKIMKSEDFGFDCSSSIEVELSRLAGAGVEDIMFTSNNTTQEEFAEALETEAVINLDDVSFIKKFPGRFPELICFRYNPGKKRTGNSIIGNPYEAKYGIMDSQVEDAYAAARRRGAKRFGIHTMVCSNDRDYTYMVETVRMLLSLCQRLEKNLGIRCEFMNIGGGLGIAYKPDQSSVDIWKLGRETEELIGRFYRKHGWAPKVFMESGRFMTGPHGVLVNRVINRKEIYQTHVGIEVAMPGLMRPGIYKTAYHHITVLDKNGKSCKHRRKEVVNVVGSICENCDRLATQRRLPVTREGDYVITHDGGAHGIAMGFNYNGRTRPQELLLHSEKFVTRIRRAETNDDLKATLRNVHGVTHLG
jgi:diaminopimelate decarboxylase